MITKTFISVWFINDNFVANDTELAIRNSGQGFSWLLYKRTSHLIEVF